MMNTPNDEQTQTEEDFAEFEPYGDEDVPDAVDRLFKERPFLKLLRHYDKDFTREYIEEIIPKIKTVDDFQQTVGLPLLLAILEKSAGKVEYRGLNHIQKDKAYLFISNHRDILLDSSLLCSALATNGFPTMKMAIGSNLFIAQWIVDFFKLNKGFIVKRNLKAKKLYEHSLELSKFIKHSIASNQSVWIAQREGRTKDGHDQTQISLLKMLFINGKDDPLGELKKMNIVPVTISYEYEPCDFQKVMKLVELQNEQRKARNPRDDIYNMLVGLDQHKGQISLTIGRPIEESSEFKKLKNASNFNDFLEELGRIIDGEIYRNFTLWKNNYIAYDRLHETVKFANAYTLDEKQSFLNYINQQIEKSATDRDSAERIFLELYSNPLVSQLSLASAKTEGN